MNIAWASPVRFDDLDEISAVLRRYPSIVAALQDFASGDWNEYFFQHFQHDTIFFAHLDANFLSHLLRLFSGKPPTDLARRAAGLMCLAITFEMKVNPTFATHEYAFTGSDPPDSRLAGFYYIDNLPPQQLADIATGRDDGRGLPALGELPTTKHFGTHRQHLRMYGLTYACLLKIVDLHRRDNSLLGNRQLAQRIRCAEELLDWMYYDFLFCGAPLRIADQLWGMRRSKTVLKGIDRCDAEKALKLCRNAAWDLVLAENWADYESKRRPFDPIHLIFTFDEVLRELAHQLLVKPEDLALSRSETLLRRFRQCWPNEVAESLTERYLRYEATLDAPSRRWNSEDRPKPSELIADLEQRIRELLGELPAT